MAPATRCRTPHRAGSRPAAPWRSHRHRCPLSAPQDFTVKGVHRDGKLDTDLKATYSTGKYSLIATLAQASGKLGLSVSAADVAPGLKLGIAGLLTDSDSGKLALDYVAPHVTLKSSATLTAAPKVDASAATRFSVRGQDVVGGGEVAYDTAKGAVTKWTLGLGYTAADYQVAALLSDKQDVTALVAHAVRPDLTLGAEVVRNLATAETALSAGVARRLPSGALQKVKVAHTGVVSVLHEQVLEGKSKVALSGQFDATDLSKAPKYGWGLVSGGVPRCGAVQGGRGVGGGGRGMAGAACSENTGRAGVMVMRTSRRAACRTVCARRTSSTRRPGEGRRERKGAARRSGGARGGARRRAQRRPACGVDGRRAAGCMCLSALGFCDSSNVQNIKHSLPTFAAPPCGGGSHKCERPGIERKTRLRTACDSLAAASGEAYALLA